MPRRSLTTRVIAAATTTALVAAGCTNPLDTSRTSDDTGTFGTTVLTLVCKRYAYADDLADGGTTDVRGDAYRDICRQGLAAPDGATPRMKALLVERERLITATDAIFPEGFLGDLQAYLTKNDFLALYDDATTERAIDALIGMLRLMKDDPATVTALERLGHRIGYRPLRPALGAVRAFVSYPELDELLLTLTTAITEGGSARGEWQHLIDALGATLRSARPDANPADRNRTLAIALDFLLRERALLGTSASAPLTLRDARGVAQVATIAPPFVDLNSDGAADVDAIGRFVDATGAAIDAPTPFDVPAGDVATPWPNRDPAGRALAATGGAPVYRYVDLDSTVLAALARDGLALFDPGKGTALDLLRGASALVGARQSATKTFASGETLTYRGYDTAQSPLLDLGYGFTQLLRDPNIADTLALGRDLVGNHEGELARLAEAVIVAFRKGDNHPEAAVAADAPLWDDLVPVLRQITANPALFTALMAALEKPEVAQLGERFRKLMAYKDRFDINPTTQAVTGSFSTLVDRTRNDSNYDRSVFQRFLHLINDSNGARACNKAGARVVDPFVGITLGTYNECALFRVDNLALFYLQSMAYAKNASGQYLCETAAGEFDGTTTAATPEGCVSRRPPAAAQGQLQLPLGRRRVVLDRHLRRRRVPRGHRRHRRHAQPPDARGAQPGAVPQPDARLPDQHHQPAARQGGRPVPVAARRHAAGAREGRLLRPDAAGRAGVRRPERRAAPGRSAGALHKHWPSRNSTNHQSVSPTSPNYVWGAGAVKLRAADRRHPRRWLADADPGRHRPDAQPHHRCAAAPTRRSSAAAVQYLTTAQAGLADRTGRTTTTTADGRPVAQLSPWHLLADAYRGKRARLTTAGAEGAAWTDSVSASWSTCSCAAPTSRAVGWRWKQPAGARRPRRRPRAGRASDRGPRRPRRSGALAVDRPAGRSPGPGDQPGVRRRRRLRGVAAGGARDPGPARPGPAVPGQRGPGQRVSSSPR
jgi:hypothetical protein